MCACILLNRITYYIAYIDALIKINYSIIVRRLPNNKLLIGIIYFCINAVADISVQLEAWLYSDKIINNKIKKRVVDSANT